MSLSDQAKEQQDVFETNFLALIEDIQLRPLLVAKWPPLMAALANAAPAAQAMSIAFDDVVRHLREAELRS